MVILVFLYDDSVKKSFFIFGFWPLAQSAWPPWSKSDVFHFGAQNQTRFSPLNLRLPDAEVCRRLYVRGTLGSKLQLQKGVIKSCLLSVTSGHAQRLNTVLCSTIVTWKPLQNLTTKEWCVIKVKQIFVYLVRASLRPTRAFWSLWYRRATFLELQWVLSANYHFFDRMGTT